MNIHWKCICRTLQRFSKGKRINQSLRIPIELYFRKKKDFQLIPILVGSLDASKLEKYGQLLAPYLCDPRNVFVISSDFCHWGRRFSYTPHNPADGEIWQHIEKLDHQGMELIEKMNLADFNVYLRSTDNTICGRYPISLLLAV
jgi:AmmeMemoRadiSam system protein B